MSTHSERIREAERKVIEAAMHWATGERASNDAELLESVRALHALALAACPKCGGTGSVTHHIDEDDTPVVIRCSGCDNGRKREEDK